MGPTNEDFEKLQQELIDTQLEMVETHIQVEAILKMVVLHCGGTVIIPREELRAFGLMDKLILEKAMQEGDNLKLVLIDPSQWGEE